MVTGKLCCCLLLSALVASVHSGAIVNAMHMKLMDDGAIVVGDVEDTSVLQLEEQDDVADLSALLDDVNRNFKSCYDKNQCIAFSAVRKSNLNNANGKLPFEATIINEGNPFNLQTNEFVPPTKGFYWLHWSVGLKDTSVDVRLEGGPRSPSVIRYYPDDNEVDITSRDELVWLNGNKDTLYLSSDFDLSSYYSDSKGLQTSFSGFCLSSTMKPFVGFSVGLSSILSKTGKIPFDIVNVDTHNGWQAQSFEYRTPKKGSYILSLSIGTYANRDVRVGLYVGQRFIAGMFEAGRSSANFGEVTLSKTIIAQAAENTPIVAALETMGANLYSDYHYHTSLMGFLYAPAGITPIAWSVATTRTVMSTDPVSFETVLVNEGNCWKTDTKRFVASEGGVYYIQLSTGRNKASWQYYTTINSAEVLVNGSPVMNVYAANTRGYYYWYNSYTPLGLASRAIVVRLQAGDELRVRVPNLPNVYDEAVYSNSYRLTSFSGFRIYA